MGDDDGTGGQGHTKPTGTDGGAAADAAGTKPAAGDGAAGAAADAAGTKPAAGDGAAGAAADAAGTKPEGSGPAAGTAQPAGAPDRYELTVPEANGFKTEFVASDLELFEGKVRKAGLTNEDAQAVLNTLPAEYADTKARFRGELEAHPSLGGAQLEAVEQRTKRALDHFLPAGTPDGDRLRRVMTLTGYGNFAPWVAFVNAVGLAIAEDRPDVRSTEGQAPSLSKAPENVLYDKSSGAGAAQ